MEILLEKWGKRRTIHTVLFELCKNAPIRRTRRKSRILTFHALQPSETRELSQKGWDEGNEILLLQATKIQLLRICVVGADRSKAGHKLGVTGRADVLRCLQSGGLLFILGFRLNQCIRSHLNSHKTALILARD